VSPLATAFDAVNAADHRKFPAVDASQYDTWVRVSVVVIENDGLVPVIAIAPDAAALCVTATRVVTADGIRCRCSTRVADVQLHIRCGGSGECDSPQHVQPLVRERGCCAEILRPSDSFSLSVFQFTPHGVAQLRHVTGHELNPSLTAGSALWGRFMNPNTVAPVRVARWARVVPVEWLAFAYRPIGDRFQTKVSHQFLLLGVVTQSPVVDGPRVHR
jgi:hypothetical protein